MSAKAWAAVAVAIISCGTATVLYVSAVHPGSQAGAQNPTIRLTSVHIGDFEPGPHAGKGGVPMLPEANAGWTLIPFVGAVLLCSTRRLWAARAGHDGNHAKSGVTN